MPEDKIKAISHVIENEAKSRTFDNRMMYSLDRVKMETIDLLF